MVRSTPRRLLALAPAFAASAAHACTVCDSAAGRSLRASLGSNFAATLAAVLSAFPVLFAAVVITQLGLTRLLASPEDKA